MIMLTLDTSLVPSTLGFEKQNCPQQNNFKSWDFSLLDTLWARLSKKIFSQIEEKNYFLL